MGNQEAGNQRRFADEVTMNISAAAATVFDTAAAAAAARAPALVSTTTLAVDSAALAVVVALATGSVPSRVAPLQQGLALPDFLQVQTLGPH